MQLKVDRIVIPTNIESLSRWKKRDSEVVPEFALNWGGNGVANGYGFGEWMAERYFRSLGYYVINNEFDLFSKESKYQRYNELIITMIGKEKCINFIQKGRELYSRGCNIENLDLFVFNTNTCFFAEVKKGKDVLREPQLRFMVLSKELLDIPCKEIYISDKDPDVLIQLETYNLDFE